ncbi:dihydrodipicolinate synthase family protein [Bacillus pseudomycoides]|uniref:Dihydrodipicolinate synthase family protein n=1 Tax=Bacillus bingmayongensis TaxID=1150157 RepID=A0ABU5K6G0_9BACI|nr:dihydrodipicolinate synthase family protein [Bacillus pseudomycoides]
MKNINVAIPTPFHDNERLYLEGFKLIVEHLKNNGIESFLVSGTTGEQHSMTIDERLQIIDYFNQQKFKGVELLFGVSATRTSDAIKLIQAIEKSIFDIILIGFPPYIQPTQQQAIFYVNELFKHTTKKVVLYNNPFRTGFDLRTESLNILITQHSNLSGLKDEGDINRYKNTKLPDDFILFSGGDINFIEKINNGCNGLSSMVGNVYPKEIKQAFNNLLMNRPVDHYKIKQLIDEVTYHQTIMNIKQHYNNLGMKVGTCRAPINTYKETVVQIV